MPKTFNRTGTEGGIEDGESTSVMLKIDAAAVLAAIGAAIEGLGAKRGELFHHNMRGIVPTEGIGWNGLVTTIEAEGIVHGSATKTVAGSWVANIGICSRIGEDGLGALANEDLQGVSVAVPSGPTTKWSGVEQDVARTIDPGEKASVGEQRGLWLITIPSFAESLLTVGGVITVRVKEATAIVITGEEEMAGWTEKSSQEVSHTVDGWMSFTAEAGEQKKKIKGVDVIVAGLLKVAAIGAYLGFVLTAYPEGAQGSPLLRTWPLGEEMAEGEQCNGFTEQVGIW
jgi:hypothetical protein